MLKVISNVTRQKYNENVEQWNFTPYEIFSTPSSLRRQHLINLTKLNSASFARALFAAVESCPDNQRKKREVPTSGGLQN